jgi:hypothetical protein
MRKKIAYIFIEGEVYTLVYYWFAKGVLMSV